MLFFKSNFAAILLTLTALLVICGCGGKTEPASAAQTEPPKVSSAAPAVSKTEKPASEQPKPADESKKPEPLPAKSSSEPPESEKAESAEPVSSAIETESEKPESSESAPAESKEEQSQAESSSSEKVVSQPMTSADISADIPQTPAQRATKLTVRMPSAPGSKCESSAKAAIDYSNAAQGYIMVKYSGSNPKVKLQITGPNKVTYTYTLHKGGYTAFPLTAGSGTYAANIFENVSGTSYALALGTSFSAKLSSSLAPYLYPNQYVNYTAQSKAIAKGEELAAKASTKIGVVQEVYNYLISNVVYDHQKAATVKSGYTPNVDSTLATKTGICFDYAALMATMLRTQDIPTRLEVGYVSGGIYHAWVSVYIPEQGWINGLIKFDGSNWSMMDPTFAASSAVPQSYTTASYSYSVKYLY